MELEVIKTKAAKPRTKKVLSVEPTRLLYNIRLRTIKWAHLGLRKPNPAELTAVRYRLHSGLEFTTALAIKTDITTVEPDTTTYYEDVVGSVGHFQLSFFASNQRIQDFETMALLGERGEILYLYEF
jgi:hypothetical protein